MIVYDHAGVMLHQGDALAVLRTLQESSVQCVVTSPPYWGLRDYGVDAQIGLEETPEAWCARLVEVFREVRRVLREDGTCWVNVGDCYGAPAGGNAAGRSSSSTLQGARREVVPRSRGVPEHTKPKDLIGLPWMLAFALRADGWWLRADIIWAKPNPMPESVTDRPTKAHEYLFLLTKGARYFYNAEAVREPAVYPDDDRKARSSVTDKRMPSARVAGIRPGSATYAKRNLRSVWTIPTEPTPDAHFATFPTALVRPCVLAGSRFGDVVLDPFAGSGTTPYVAKELGRRAVGIEINRDYCDLAVRRLRQDVLPLAPREGATA